jgi:hypothetical protein
MENVLIYTNRLRICGKYLIVYLENKQKESMNAYMEKTQRDSWHILLICQET